MSKRPRAGYLCLLGLLLATAGQAHEFWLAPHDYRIGPRQPLRADIMVGQHFNGERFPYIPRNTLRFDITQGRFTRAVQSRIGDLPAVDEPVTGEGLLILSHVSGDAEATFDNLDEFAAYLGKAGLEWVLDAHARRGLPTENFTEAYQRFAKTLVAIGGGGGADRALGMRLEWVVETNPYQTRQQEYRAQLLWRGEPLSGATAQLFVRRDDGVSEQVLTTDHSGRVHFPVEQGGEVLLNAVQMIEPQQAQRDWQPNVLWKSLWASVTFRVE